MAKIKHTTFRLDPEIKAAFKKETEYNCVDMTETVEKLMIGYVKASKKRRNLESV